MLRPQDLVLALHLSLGRPATQGEMARCLGLSQAEVSNALKRLQQARLLMNDARSVVLPRLFEVCVHGVPYFLPAQLGRRARGVPTVALIQPLLGKVAGEEGELVWPYKDGTERAPSLEPIHPCVPHAASQDERLHTLLALVDAIRVGKSRMVTLATNELRARLLNPEVAS